MCNLFCLFLFVPILLAIAYIDCRTYTIANWHLGCLLIFGFIAQMPDSWPLFLNCCFVSLTFLPVYYLSDGLGGGDVKLAYCLAAALSYDELCLTIFCALGTALVYGSYQCLRQGTAAFRLPFAPFLAGGTLLVLLRRLS